MPTMGGMRISCPVESSPRISAYKTKLAEIIPSLRLSSQPLSPRFSNRRFSASKGLLAIPAFFSQDYFFISSACSPGIMPYFIELSLGRFTMKRIGILSDTHLISCTESLQKQIDRAFADCDILIHAGDLTDLLVLDAFKGREVHAVCGNSCNVTTQQTLPRHISIMIEKYTIGICHGDGSGHDLEDRLFHLFPTADCIIYGHTHKAEQRRLGSLLLINPGSFQGTGKYGATGTYAHLIVKEGGLSATIHMLPPGT